MPAPAALTINPIKADLVAFLKAQAEALGVKSVKSDISPQSIVEAMQKEIPAFPGLIVNYAGRTITRSGTTMEAAAAFAIFVADRNISGPYVSGEESIDLIEKIVELLDGKKISATQKTWFEFVGDQLMYQDVTLVIYQLIFRTTTLHLRRTI